MANTTFKLRRSSVAGKSPNTSTLSIGELGINLTDRKLFSSDGTNIFETGSNLTSLSVFSDVSIGNSTVNTTINSTALSVKSIVANGSLGTATQVLSSNGTGIYWATSSGSSGASRTYSVTTVSGTQNTFSTPENYVTGSTDVYLNGVHLSNSEYSENSSNTIQLTEDAPNGSIVEVSGWVTINTLVAGSNTTVQFNDSGYINSSSSFTWNKDSNTLTVGNSSVNTVINSTSLTVKSIVANGGIGTANQVLTSNGTGIYWANGGGGGSLTTFTANVGSGSANSFTITHNLNSYLLLTSVREQSSGYIVYPDIQQDSSNTMILSFVDNPTANQYFLLIAKVE